MQLITKQLPNNHNIFFYGCVHEGSVLSSQKGWNKLVNVLNSEYEGCSINFAVDMGDMIEAIMVDDKRADAQKLKEPFPLDQKRMASKKREPIKDKLITILMGNHERKLWRFGDITSEVCEELGVPYGTYSSKISFLDTNGNLMYKTFVTHGSRSITSTADDPLRRRTNMNLILKRQLKFKAGDCAVMIKGHTHKLLVCKPDSELFLYDDGKEIRQGYTGWGQNEQYIHPDARWYGNSGSFLKLYGKGISGYAEIFEYDPVELGFLVLVVRNKKIIELKLYLINL